MVVRLAGAVAVLALTACQMPGFGPKAELPTASATLHWATVQLPRGSYCWRSIGHGECADSAGPDLLLKTGYLKPYRTAGGFEVKISFHSTSPLQHLEVRLMQGPGGSAGPIGLSGADTFAIGMSQPAANGVYVYVNTGDWPEGSVDFFLVLDLIPGAA